MFSLTKIENLEWQLGEDINFAASLVNCESRYRLLMSFWTYDNSNFLKATKLMFSPNCCVRFSIFVTESMKFEWQCSQYLKFDLTCAEGPVGC